jgi:PadR family transcriptional regulator PadR
METPVTAKAVIMAVLFRGKSYGLEIIEKVSERTKGAIQLNEGSVYPTLKAMEREGLLRRYTQEWHRAVPCCRRQRGSDEI